MKHYNSIFACLLAVCCMVISSCTTLKPTAVRVSDPDYNMRVKVSDPHYLRKPNGMGYTLTIAGPVAGAAVGSTIGLSKSVNKDGIRQKSTIGNMAIGALVGSAVSFITSRLAHYNKRVGIRNINKWISDAHGDYIYLNSLGESYLMIHRDAERNYTVQDLRDVEHFAAAFPRSLYSDGVFDQALKKLPRSSMPDIIALYPNAKNLNEAKLRYIRESTDFPTMLAALKKYPQSVDLQEYFVKVIDNADQALQFKQMYPQTNLGRKAVCNSFNSPVSLAQYKALANAYPQDYVLSSSDFPAGQSFKLKNYYNARLAWTGTNSQQALDAMNTDLRWITYVGKCDDVLGGYWAYFEKTYSSGIDVVNAISKVKTKPFAQSSGINGETTLKYVESQFEKLIREKVTVVKTEGHTNKDPEFSKWKDALVTAGLVMSNSPLEAIVYGELKNDSKFDLMVEATCHGSVVSITKIDGGAIGMLAKLVGTPTEKTEIIGSFKELGSYRVVVPAGKTAPYAIHVDLGKTNMSYVRDAGINIDFIAKASTNVYFADMGVDLKLNTSPITEEQQKVQQGYLQMASNGMDVSGMRDVMSSKRFNQAQWAREFSESMERAGSSNYSSSSSSSSSKSSSSKSSDDDDEVMYTAIFQVTQGGEKVYQPRVELYLNRILGARYNESFDGNNKGLVTVEWPAHLGESVEMDVTISQSGFLTRDYWHLNKFTLKRGRTYNIELNHYKKD